MNIPAPSNPSRFLRRYRTMLAGFNVYRLGGLVADAVSPPRIHTVVHGMTAESPAEVVATGDYGVVFRINPRLVMALSHTGMAFVESPLHGMVFRARVLDVREELGSVVLSDFELVSEIHERRSSARVAPPQPVGVRMSSPQLDLRGQVADLSVAALAAEFGVDEALSLTDFAERSRSEVRVVTSLEEGDKLRFTGRIHRIAPNLRDDVTLWRVVVNLGGDTEADRVLQEYVRSRAAEILARLEHASSDETTPVASGPEAEDEV